MNRKEKRYYSLLSELNRFRYRIKQSVDMINEGLKVMKSPYLSLSFGKDSTVLAHLLMQIYHDIPMVYVNCGEFDEWPDTIRVKSEFMDRFNPNLTELKSMSIMEAYMKSDFHIQDEEINKETKKAQKDYSKSLGKCLDDYAELNGYDGTFIGLRKEESNNRQRLFVMRDYLYFAKTRNSWACHPLMNWTGRDIWAYIVKYNLPYNELYDLALEGRELARNGAMFGTRSARYGRLSFLKKSYPAWFNKFAEKYSEVRNYV